MIPYSSLVSPVSVARATFYSLRRIKKKNSASSPLNFTSQVLVIITIMLHAVTLSLSFPFLHEFVLLY